MDQTTCVIIDDLPSISNHDFTVNWHNWNCQQQKYSDRWEKCEKVSREEIQQTLMTIVHLIEQAT